MGNFVKLGQPRPLFISLRKLIDKPMLWMSQGFEQGSLE